MEPIYGHFRQNGWPGFPVVSVGYFFLKLRLLWFKQIDRVVPAGELRCPLLVLHGKDDPISRFESGQQIAQAAKQGTFVEFPGGTHGDLAESDPQKYAQALADFFQSLAGQGSTGNDL